MAFNLSHLFNLIFGLSLFFLFFHTNWFTFNFNNNIPTTNNSLSVSDHHNMFTSSSNRKILVGKVDFTPYLRHRHHRHGHRRHVAAKHEPGGSEIDPRYGAEKRLVPTGPNPLHH